ncbi:hypothetical protein VoSk93_08220 [Vibrio owensii]
MARNRLNQSRKDKHYSEINFRLPKALFRLNWSPDKIIGYLRGRGYPRRKGVKGIITIGNGLIK